ncbi:unnamed protein product, partial [Nesidiocoris tenuis]
MLGNSYPNGGANYRKPWFSNTMRYLRTNFEQSLIVAVIIIGARSTRMEKTDLLSLRRDHHHDEYSTLLMISSRHGGKFDFDFDYEFDFLFHCEFDFNFDYEFDFLFHCEFDFNFDYEFDFLFHCELDLDFDYEFDFLFH